jgi:septal ring factor EnvC (AmiA/AmiB activator)
MTRDDQVHELQGELAERERELAALGRENAKLRAELTAMTEKREEADRLLAETIDLIEDQAVKQGVSMPWRD